MRLSSWKVWTPNKTPCTQSHIVSNSICMCSGVGEDIALEKNQQTSVILFCWKASDSLEEWLIPSSVS